MSHPVSQVSPNVLAFTTPPGVSILAVADLAILVVAMTGSLYSQDRMRPRRVRLPWGARAKGIAGPLMEAPDHDAVIVSTPAHDHGVRPASRHSRLPHKQGNARCRRWVSGNVPRSDTWQSHTSACEPLCGHRSMSHPRCGSGRGIRRSRGNAVLGATPRGERVQLSTASNT